MKRFLVFIAVSIGSAFITVSSFANAEYDTHKKKAVSTYHAIKNKGFVRLTLNNQLSEKIYQDYLKSVDPSYSLFTKVDIKKFERYKHDFDELQPAGWVNAVDEIYKASLLSEIMRDKYWLEILSSKQKGLDFSKSESIIKEMEVINRPYHDAEQKNLFRKQLKLELLTQKALGKSDMEIKERLEKRIMARLKRVEEKLADGSYRESAFESYMNSLLSQYDVHSKYFSSQQKENFNIDLKLELVGIGAELTVKDGVVTVIRTVPGSPAEKSGLKSNDRIIAVAQEGKQEVDVVDMPLGDVVSLIRGKKGSVVMLTVKPKQSDVAKSIKITRDIVKLEDQKAKSEIISVGEGNNKVNVGVITIPSFYDGVFRDVVNIIKDYDKSDVLINGIMLDLRNNGGGLLDEAVNIASIFVENGTIVYTKEKGFSKTALIDRFPSVAFPLPVVVLVNRFSASASEIVAAAIQDYGAGIVVGSKSYGKGTVQSVSSNGELKFTVSMYYRPSGYSVQQRGVDPDIQFESLINGEEFGEGKHGNSIAWQKLNDVNFVRQANSSFSEMIKSLTRASQQRRDKDPDFHYISKSVNLAKEDSKQKTIPLNETAFIAMIERKKKTMLKLENDRRQAKGLELISNLDDIDYEQENKTGVQRGVLLEGVNVLKDYIFYLGD